MKRFFSFFILLLIVFSTCTAMAAEPIRVAIMPVINGTYSDNQEVMQEIDRQLNGYFKTPLASIVQFYTMLPRPDVVQAMPKTPERKSTLAITEPLLVGIADKMGADVVIGVKLDEYSSAMVVTKDGSLLQQSDVELRYRMYFKNQKPQYVSRKLQRHYFGDATAQSGPDVLLHQLMDEIRDVLTRNVPLVHY